MDVSALVSSVTGATQLVKLLVNERDRQKAAAIEIQLTDKLTQAQIQLMQVLGAVIEKDGRIQTLAERVRELETEKSEKARYRLAKVGVIGDFYAQELRPPAELVECADELPHFICQPCFDIRKQKSILRFIGNFCICPTCNRREQIKASAPSAVTPRRRSSIPGIPRDW